MLARTFRPLKFRGNAGAMASPNLAILTILKPLDGTFEKRKYKLVILLKETN